MVVRSREATWRNRPTCCPAIRALAGCARAEPFDAKSCWCNQFKQHPNGHRPHLCGDDADALFRHFHTVNKSVFNNALNCPFTPCPSPPGTPYELSPHDCESNHHFNGTHQEPFDVRYAIWTAPNRTTNNISISTAQCCTLE